MIIIYYIHSVLLLHCHSLSVSMGSLLSRLICRQWFLRVPGGTGDEGFTGKLRGHWVCWFINMHWGLKAGDHLWKCCSLHFPLSLFFVVILSTWVKVLIEKNNNLFVLMKALEPSINIFYEDLWMLLNVSKNLWLSAKRVHIFSVTKWLMNIIGLTNFLHLIYYIFNLLLF